MFILQIQDSSSFGGFGGFGGGGFQALGRGLVVRPNPLGQALQGAISGFQTGRNIKKNLRQERLDREIEEKQRKFLETQNPLFGLIKDPNEAIEMLIKEKQDLAEMSRKYGHDEAIENLKSKNEFKLKEMELRAKGIQTQEQQEFDLHSALALNAAKTNSELKIEAAKLKSSQIIGTQEHNQKLIQMEEQIMKNEAIFMGFDAALDAEAKKRNVSPTLVESLKRSIRKGNLTKIDKDILNVITGSVGVGGSSNAQAIIDALNEDEETEEEPFTPAQNFSAVPQAQTKGGFSRLLGFN